MLEDTFRREKLISDLAALSADAHRTTMDATEHLLKKHVPDFQTLSLPDQAQVLGVLCRYWITAGLAAVFIPVHKRTTALSVVQLVNQLMVTVNDALPEDYKIPEGLIHPK